MFIKKWEDLPEFMRNDKVKPYYDNLKRKHISLLIKRLIDLFLSITLLILFLPIMVLISLAIITDSEGKIIYRQERVTQYGKTFRIHKFRTMIPDADKNGQLVTTKDDRRITKVGLFLRKYRLDELPQLIDVLQGHMSFVGTRPETKKFVDGYEEEYYATLLLPAGITSEASIKYKDESDLLKLKADNDIIYLKKILPEKMKYNLKSIYNFNLRNDMVLMVKTFLIVISK